MKFSFRKFDVAYVSIHPFRTACIDSLSHHNHMFTDILHFYRVIVCIHVSFQTKMYARPPLCSALTTTGVNVACTSVSLLSNSHVSPPVLVYCSASAHAKQKKAAQTPCLRQVRQQNHEWTKITR
ncbi:unnamed protein product [Alternaria burnsii]|nr:unnamed protein product [Alternaria burnsii]